MSTIPFVLFSIEMVVIFSLSYKDNGRILGVDQYCFEQMKKNFVMIINNESKIYPPLYLTPEECEVDGRIVLYVYILVGKAVYRNASRILTIIMSLTLILQIIRTWFLTFMPISKALIL